MSILTEEEIRAIWKNDGLRNEQLEFRCAIAKQAIDALLAKLAGMELPDPFGLFCGVRHDPPKTKEFWGMLNEGADNGSKCNLYTAAQLHQAYAQGAASQLSAEPVGYLNPSGGYRTDGYMKKLASGLEHETFTIPLYTLKESS